MGREVTCSALHQKSSTSPPPSYVFLFTVFAEISRFPSFFKEARHPAPGLLCHHRELSEGFNVSHLTGRQRSFIPDGGKHGLSIGTTGSGTGVGASRRSGRGRAGTGCMGTIGAGRLGTTVGASVGACVDAVVGAATLLSEIIRLTLLSNTTFLRAPAEIPFGKTAE
jgi:hypothetical protein